MRNIYEAPELIPVKFITEDILTFSTPYAQTEGIEDGGDAAPEA